MGEDVLEIFYHQLTGIDELNNEYMKLIRFTPNGPYLTMIKLKVFTKVEKQKS